MSAPKTRGAGGAAGQWKADGNGETARPVHHRPAAGRHGSETILTRNASHRDEQAALDALVWLVGQRIECRCPICRYVPRHAEPLGPTLPTAA